MSDNCTSDRYQSGRVYHYLCLGCGQLKKDELFTEDKPLRPPFYDRPDEHDCQVCQECKENGIENPIFQRTPDGYIIPEPSVVVWCLDCDWEKVVNDRWTNHPKKIRSRAKKAASGHIGNSEGCESYDLGGLLARADGGTKRYQDTDSDQP